MKKVVIYWTETGLIVRNKICEYFNIPRSMTVNGETYCEIAEDMMDKLIATEKRGLIVIRNKKFK